MQKLVFTNGGGQSIDLTSGNFGITNWEGLSGAELNIQTQQVPFQDGGVFLDALIEQREVSVTVAIQDNNNLSLRYELKRQLISALNPKLGEGVLVYTNDYLSRQIKAVPQLPIFENKNSNDAGTLKASVTFSCPSPYWEDVEETEVHISSGITVTNINNTGDASLGIEIDIEEGSTDILIQNQQGKKIELKNTEGAFPKLKINTEVGKKSVSGYGLIFAPKAYTITTQLQGNPTIESSVIKMGQYYFTYIVNNTNVAFIKSENLTEWEQVGNLQTLSDFGGIYNTRIEFLYNPTDNKIYLLTSSTLSISADNGVTWTHENINYTSMCINEKTGEMFFSQLGNFESSTCIYNPVTQDVMEAYRSTNEGVDGLKVRIHRNGSYFEKFNAGTFFDIVSFVNSLGQYIVYSENPWSSESIVLDWNGNEVSGFLNGLGWIEREEGYYGVYNIPYTTANSGVNFINKSMTAIVTNIQMFPHHVKPSVIDNDLIVFDVNTHYCYTTQSVDTFISYLSKDSDMTLGLEVGYNSFSVISDKGMDIKYRQKYIGV